MSIFHIIHENEQSILDATPARAVRCRTRIAKKTFIPNMACLMLNDEFIPASTTLIAKFNATFLTQSTRQIDCEKVSFLSHACNICPRFACVSACSPLRSHYSKICNDKSIFFTCRSTALDKNAKTGSGSDYRLCELSTVPQDFFFSCVCQIHEGKHFLMAYCTHPEVPRIMNYNL